MTKCGLIVILGNIQIIVYFNVFIIRTIYNEIKFVIIY